MNILRTPFDFEDWSIQVNCFDVSSSVQEIKTEIGKWTNFTLFFSRGENELSDGTAFTIEITNESSEFLEVHPAFLEIYSRNFTEWEHVFYVRCIKAGSFPLGINVDSSAEQVRLSGRPHILVDVIRSNTLEDLSSFCWIISYTILFLSAYPQLIANHLRRSTSRLNQDYILLTIFASTTLFLWILLSNYVSEESRNLRQHEIEYFLDLLLPLHGVIVAVLLLLQGFVFNGSFVFSDFCKLFLCVVALMACTIYTCASSTLSAYLYFLAVSYSLTLMANAVRYLPQIFQNYSEKSSEGWCIWTSVFESIGLVLAVADLVLLKYNHDDLKGTLSCDYQFWLRLWTITNHLVLMVQDRCYRFRALLLQVSVKFDDYVYLYRETA